MNNFTVGRDAAADIPIADTSVSRLHAVISYAGAGLLMVTDKGSSNGTFVVSKGVARAIQSERVNAADSIRFGSVEIGVADLLEILRQKSAAPAAKVASPMQSQRLVRCDCGAVKSVGASCPFCSS